MIGAYSIDKSSWPRGQWDSEPDRLQWVDQSTGLDCLAVRNVNSGSWCGYVGVAPSHPWHGKDYDKIEAGCHGGLTYSDNCQGNVWHVPAPGRHDDVWWVGFDCAHAWDFSPGLAALYNRPGPDEFETYRTLAFVRDECASLAKQAKGE